MGVVFHPVSDPELGSRGDAFVIAYVRGARAAGNADAERQGIAHLLYRYEDLVRVRVRATVPVGDVEDVVHDVFVSALSSVFDGVAIGQFVNWLKRIAQRRIADFTRDHAPRRHHERSLEASDDGPEPAVGDDAERIAARVVVEQALASVENPMHRATIEVWLAEDLPSREIAELMGTSETNVDQIKSRFRKDLRALLAEQAPKERETAP